MSRPPREAREWLSKIGAKGGAKGGKTKGKSKVRGDAEYYRKIGQKSARMRHLNKALLAVAKKYAQTEHSVFCATTYAIESLCDCGYAAAKATIDEAERVTD